MQSTWFCNLLYSVMAVGRWSGFFYTSDLAGGMDSVKVV